MEQIVACKSLVATFKDEKMMLDGPHEVNFDIKKGKNFHISIEQLGIRKITVTSDEDVSVFDLDALFLSIERLLMLLDGTFIPLSKIQLSESDMENEDILHSYEEQLIERRLSYFSSADFCNYSNDKMMQFDSVITADLFYKWEKLLDELDVVHQMYLYSVSNSGITVDVKCAFLVELAEPLIEIVKEHTNLFSSLFPGERGTTLRNCLEALIDKFGTDIFENELSNNYDEFLSTMVNSRVRIMHIKRKQKGLHFTGNESVLYSSKISLLYRRTLFELLGINENHYKDNLKKCVSELNIWNNVLNDFLIKISKVASEKGHN